jgi:glycosyltransferase involved in cell wall biosynthesis
VEFRPYVPFAELPDLYRGALALVYPSLWEGFGLPVLEAMACGTPVLTSLGSGTEEAAGAGALLVDPTDTAALAEAMQALVEQSALRQQLRQQGLLQANGFCWQRTWDRPFVPDVEAVPAAEREYYERHGCFQHNNPGLIDLGKDVLFDLITQPAGARPQAK